MTILLLTRVLDPPELQYLLIKNELQAPEKQGSVLSRYPESYPGPDVLQRAEVLTRAGRFRGEFWRGSETGDPNFAGMSTDAEPRLLPKDSEGATASVEALGREQGRPVASAETRTRGAGVPQQYLRPSAVWGGTVISAIS